MPLFLNHIEGSKSGQLESFDSDQIRIGRQSDNDVKFDPQKDVSVSGYHAEIYRDGEAFFVKDLQSRNGTFLNSRKIDQPVRLKEGDIIQFSSRGPKVVFTTRDPSLASATAVMEAGAASGAAVSRSEEKSEPKRKPGLWQRVKPHAFDRRSGYRPIGARRSGSLPGVCFVGSTDRCGRHFGVDRRPIPELAILEETKGASRAADSGASGKGSKPRARR
jgi:hypothetical protein